MKIKVEGCWSGNDKYNFRCTTPSGERFYVGENTDGNSWCREYATELRDYVERKYGVNRNSIKVDVL